MGIFYGKNGTNAPADSHQKRSHTPDLHLSKDETPPSEGM
jgi:hypothetical protein